MANSPQPPSGGPAVPPAPTPTPTPAPAPAPAPVAQPTVPPAQPQVVTTTQGAQAPYIIVIPPAPAPAPVVPPAPAPAPAPVPQSNNGTLTGVVVLIAVLLAIILGILLARQCWSVSKATPAPAITNVVVQAAGLTEPGKVELPKSACREEDPPRRRAPRPPTTAPVSVIVNVTNIVNVSACPPPPQPQPAEKPAGYIPQDSPAVTQSEYFREGCVATEVVADNTQQVEYYQDQPSHTCHSACDHRGGSFLSILNGWRPNIDINVGNGNAVLGHSGGYGSYGRYHRPAPYYQPRYCPPPVVYRPPPPRYCPPPQPRVVERRHAHPPGRPCNPGCRMIPRGY